MTAVSDTAPANAAASRKRRWTVIALVGLIAVAVLGWTAARQIRSPAQVAADTAPPKPSVITVPVVQRRLSTTVIVRGTVRFGAPQSVSLATSRLEQGSDIVTRAPRKGARLRVGEVAMSVDGRPVFVLPGAIPMHRDLQPGDRGPDVLQLEQALAGSGVQPGAVDGRFNADTQAAVAAFYLRAGWDPFGATDQQLEQLRTAEAAAATARDAQLQAINTAEQARRGATPGDVEQARIDATTARDAEDTAVLGVATARGKLANARTLAASLRGGDVVAAANNRRDQALADADIAVKRGAVTAALDDARVADLRRFEVALDAPLSERETAAAAARQAAEAVGRANAELAAAIAAADAIRAGSPAAVQKARADVASADRDVRVAAAELDRAREGVITARRQRDLAGRRVRALTRPTDTGTLRAIVGAAAAEARRTRAEVSRLARTAGVQVPADEVVFFPNLPLRVDSVKARRGSTLAESVMTVTGSRLTVDSSLSAADAKLVRSGDPVVIEEQDLGVRAQGRVGRVATTPGTNRVDPNRFYLSIVPSEPLPSLVGASVKLTIRVRSTQGKVLALPASALSVGGDGSSRAQVRRNGRTQLVKVVPGLAAEGLVEVRRTDEGRLAAGDLVVVGASGGGPGP